MTKKIETIFINWKGDTNFFNLNFGKFFLSNVIHYNSFLLEFEMWNFSVKWHTMHFCQFDGICNKRSMAFVSFYETDHAKTHCFYKHYELF